MTYLLRLRSLLVHPAQADYPAPQLLSLIVSVLCTESLVERQSWTSYAYNTYITLVGKYTTLNNQHGYTVYIRDCV